MAPHRWLKVSMAKGAIRSPGMATFEATAAGAPAWAWAWRGSGEGDGVGQIVELGGASWAIDAMASDVEPNPSPLPSPARRPAYVPLPRTV